MTDELGHYIQFMIPALEQEMKAVLHFNGESSDLFFGMLQYHMGWVDEDLKPTTVTSGKRIRPILCLLSCQAAGGDWRQALPAAAAIELLHNFSLIHDDIEDASPTRRGRRTLWKIWGIEQAINSGDGMFALAHLAMSRLVDRGATTDITVQALRRFDETCLALTQGQHADMDFEQRDQVSVDEYMAMITGKTAVLLSLSAELGALIAGAPSGIIHHYAQFGLNTGLAFQIIDDILGIWGNESITGKSAATDIKTKKKSLPVLYGLAQNGALQLLYSQDDITDDLISTAIRLLDESGARHFATEQASAYSKKALENLEATQAAGHSAAALYQLANNLLKRNY